MWGRGQICWIRLDMAMTLRKYRREMKQRKWQHEISTGRKSNKEGLYDCTERSGGATANSWCKCAYTCTKMTNYCKEIPVSYACRRLTEYKNMKSYEVWARSRQQSVLIKKSNQIDLIRLFFPVFLYLIQSYILVKFSYLVQFSY